MAPFICHTNVVFQIYTHTQTCTYTYIHINTNRAKTVERQYAQANTMMKEIDRLLVGRLNDSMNRCGANKAK